MVRLICGIWRFDGRAVDSAMLDAMLDAMRPAGKSCQSAQVIDHAIGMAMLSISPISTASPGPPTIVQTQTGFIAADARLYADTRAEHDPGELIARLSKDSNADLASLHGDFAFAQWDHSHSRLRLGRDQFGARPLQFAVLPGKHVAFASLPSALLRTGLASRALDDTSIASYPINERPLPGRTYFRDVQSVRAAHIVEIGTDQIAKQKRYWRLPLEPLLPFDTDPELVATEIRRLLIQAVNRRLPDAGPVAAHMSGGLDSTPISVLAARAIREENRSVFAYSYQENPVAGISIIDESAYVNEAADSEPNLYLRPIYLSGWFETLRQGMDADTLLPLAPDEPENAVLADAAANGAGIMLSGWGGDQIVTSFGGGWFGELARMGQWRRLLDFVTEKSSRSGLSRPRLLASLAWHMLLPPRLAPYYQRLRGMKPWLKNARFTAKHKRRLVRYEMRPWDADDSRANRRSEMEAFWIPYRLEAFAQLGARHGIAYAYPMLDRDLIAYAMRLPGIMFRRGGISRRVIRDALEGIVPESLRWREDKYAAFPLEPLRIALQRPDIIELFTALGREQLVREYLEIDEIIAYLRSGREAQEIINLIAADTLAGQQPDLDEDEHSRPLRLAMFLKAQAAIAQVDA